MQGDGGRRRVWVMGEEKGGGKLKLGGAQENAGIANDEEITKLVCVQGDGGRARRRTTGAGR